MTKGKKTEKQTVVCKACKGNFASTSMKFDGFLCSSDAQIVRHLITKGNMTFEDCIAIGWLPKGTDSLGSTRVSMADRLKARAAEAGIKLKPADAAHFDRKSKN